LENKGNTARESGEHTRRTRRVLYENCEEHSKKIRVALWRSREEGDTKRTREVLWGIGRNTLGVSEKHSGETVRNKGSTRRNLSRNIREALQLRNGMCFEGMAEDNSDEPGEQLEGNWISVLGDLGECSRSTRRALWRKREEHCIRDPEEHE
jgi:hypothetical protein